jgi:hypothetical protein
MLAKCGRLVDGEKRSGTLCRSKRDGWTEEREGNLRLGFELREAAEEKASLDVVGS